MSIEVSIDTDKKRLNLDLIHHFLTQSYWSPGIPKSVVAQAIENSLCFGVYIDSQQIGFARVISDYTTFAYLADVFILESYRGKGFSKQLLQAVMAHSKLQNLRRFMLITRDAHDLYRQFNFSVAATPERIMEIRRANPYQSTITD